MTNSTQETEHEPPVPATARLHGFFETEHLKADLKGRSARAAAVTMTSQTIKFLMQTGSVVVLARLLTPEDYGLIAMVTAITGFVALFKDMGLSIATIQRAGINHSQVSTLFWVNVAVSFSLALILAAAAPTISWFYGEPQLTLVTLALAGTFILSGLTVQHQALLNRQMRFSALAAAEIVSLATGIITGIVLALYGTGYWALVGSSAATTLVYMVLIWVFCRWRPGLPVRGAGVRSMLTFGGHITAFDIVNYFARNSDNILLGRFCGANILGLYSRAYNIMMLPISQVRQPLFAVAIPALSHIQNDHIRYKRYYIKVVTLLAFVTMPLMAFLFVCADQVIYLLLGSKWLGAADIFRILCISAFIQPVAGSVGLVLISLGQSKRYITIGTISSIIAVISFILGLRRGAIGVATAYTVSTYVLFLPTVWYCLKRSSISIGDFFSAIWRPALASLCMGTAIFAIASFLANPHAIMMICVSFVLGLVAYVLVLVLIPGGAQVLRELLSEGLIVLKKR